jgi:hypothetical protein
LQGFGKGIPLSRFEEGAQDADKAPKASVEGVKRGHSSSINMFMVYKEERPLTLFSGEAAFLMGDGEWK